MTGLTPALRALLGFLSEVWAGWKRHDCERMGAAMAFYALFSVAPVLLIATSLVGFVVGESTAQGELKLQLGQLLGPATASTVLGLVQQAHRPRAELTAAALGLLALVWSSTRAFAQLQVALDDIFEVEVEGRALVGALRQRVLAFSLVLGMGLLMGLSAVVNGVLSGLLRWSEGWVHAPASLLYGLSDVSSFVVLALGYAAIYQLLPRHRAGLADVLRGAAAAAALFTLGRHGIGLYLAKADPGSAYGASGSLVVLLLWLYYSALSVLLGAEVVVVGHQRRRAAAAKAASE